MKLEQLLRQIYRIASQRPNGFTYNPVVGHFVQFGYAVASSRTQDSFGLSGLHRVVKFYMNHRDYSIGGWKNEDGAMQFDASMVYLSIEDAILAAIANRQRAIFDLNSGQQILACDYGKYCILAGVA